MLLMYGMSHFWCNFISPWFVLILNGLSESNMFYMYFGSHKNVSIESMSNRISSFMLTTCTNEQFNPDHPINVFSFLLDKMLPIFLLSSSFFDCTFCWTLFIAHSDFGILSLVLQSGDLCLFFFNRRTFLIFLQSESGVVSLFSLYSLLLFYFWRLRYYLLLYLYQTYDYSTLCSSQQLLSGTDCFPVIFENLDSV